MKYSILAASFILLCFTFSIGAPIPRTLRARKPCIGIGKVGVQSVLALINVGVQDVPILSEQQQCTENSIINDGDDPLSHILDEIPIISGNGSANGRKK